MKTDINPRKRETIPGDGSVDRLSRGSNQSGMRAYNERLVLSLLRRHGALAKADIAQMTGLSAQTVSVIMRELEKDGLLLRGRPQRVAGKVGQPSVPIALNPGGAYFFGLKLGRRSSDLVLIDFVGNIVTNTRQTYPYPTPAGIIEFTVRAVAEIGAGLDAEQRPRLAGLGIAMPFELWNWAETVGAPAAVMDAWRDTDMQREIQARFEFPVYLQNDATAACGAELTFGQRVELRDFLYFYFGYFIGGGVVLQGNLYSGTAGNAGAIGPLRVPDENGRIRQLLDIASLSVLERLLQSAGCDARSIWEGTEDWHVDERALAAWVEGSAHGIAQAVLAAQALIDFEAIVIDGWLPGAVRAAIVAAVERHLAAIDFTGLKRPAIVEGSVGRDARALGAASLPLSLRFMTDRNAFLKV